MRRLYNEREVLTNEGLEIDQKVSVFIRQLLQEYESVSVRDMESVINNAVSGTSAEFLLTRQYRQHMNGH